MFNDKSILITGGTGSFGRKYVGNLLKNFKPRRLVIYSRDELKQFEMQQEFDADAACAISSATCATASGCARPCTASTSSSTPQR